MHVAEHMIEVAGAPVFYRRAPSADETAPPPATGGTPLYLHSVPTSSDDWLQFLEQGGGIAPDLLGFGRSSKAGNLDYSLSAYVDFVEAFLATVGVQRVALVGHGWGAAIALVFAQRHPERLDRIVLIDALPLLDGFQWPALVRRWRAPGLGELLMGSVNKRLLARALRAGTTGPSAWPAERVNRVWEQFDQGTQRAILRLHRSTDPQGLARAGAELGQLQAPALVLWGERDPWLAASFADAYVRRLPHATLARVANAGHWPWLDQRNVIEHVLAFLDETKGSSARRDGRCGPDR